MDAPLDDTVPAERAITLRDLLTFRLGLGFGAGMWGPPGTVPIMDALNDLPNGKPAPALVPGPDEWMRRVGALLIARASGRTLEEFLRERIFEPLGMPDTGFWVPAASIDRLPPLLATDPGTGETVLDDPPSGQWAVPPAFESGSGGLVSTAADYATFAARICADPRWSCDQISRNARNLADVPRSRPASWPASPRG